MSFDINSLVLYILLLNLRLVILSLLLLSTFLDLVLVFDKFQLLVLQNVHKGNCSHVRIVCCLVVVTKQFSSIIVDKTVFRVELTLNVMHEFGVICAFLIDFTKRSLEEYGPASGTTEGLHSKAKGR